jgi:hypothetical protein
MQGVKVSGHDEFGAANAESLVIDPFKAWLCRLVATRASLSRKSRQPVAHFRLPRSSLTLWPSMAKKSIGQWHVRVSTRA